MGVIALMFATLLVNLVTSKTKLTSEREINVLSELPATVFTLQIRQIQSTDAAAPAVPAGNNLFVVDSRAPSQDIQKNLEAISTIFPFTNKIGKKTEEGSEGNSKLFSSVDGNVRGNKEKNVITNFLRPGKTIKDLRLTWNDCLETISRDNLIDKNVYSDTENSNNGFRLPERFEVASIWNKRNVESKLTDVELEKSIYLKNSRSEERRQQKSDSIFIRKVTEIPISNTDTNESTVQIIPITREVFRDTVQQNITQNVIVTENSVITSYTEDWFERKDLTKIRFNGLPQRETYLIPTLKLGEGFHPFNFMSEFFDLIYPFDFPVGLIKDIIWGEFTFPYSFLQSIKVESTFLAFIIVFACIALVIPSYLLILFILSLFAKSSCEDEIETGALFPDAEESNCHDKTLIVVTVLIVLLCCGLLAGMEVSNEQAHHSASVSRNVMRCACSDIATWLTSTARELHHSLVSPVDLVMYAYRDDLKNVEKLLGVPIQQAISSESGIDLVFDSLADIITESEDISNKISSLRDISIKASGLADTASDRIRDLARQLDNLKKHCTVKDMPLCDTVNTNSLELRMRFDLILGEQQLLELRILGVDNLTQAVSAARQEFRTLPSAISAQTAKIREDILNDIEVRRQEVHSSGNIVNNIVRHLTGRLHSVVRRLESALDRIQRYEFWRWILMIVCVVAFVFVMLLFLMAMMCGCGNAKSHAKRTLKVSAICLCLASLILWVVVSTIFLISSHAEVYVCHALKDSPQYGTLSALFDRPSPLLPNNEGIFDALFRELENITIDVSVGDVLRDCEMDRPAYVVFQVDRILDINKETSYFEWEELQADLGRLAPAIDMGFLKTISLYFSKLLNDVLVVTDISLPKYREDYNMPVVGKDLPSLVDQLENVAAQLSDLVTAGNLETLATRTERLYQMNVKPLEQFRAEMVFKLTELELQLAPFRKKLNISLSHIHTAQYYIDNQGTVIARKKVSTYVSRLISHAAGWRTHVLTSVSKDAARCRPLFNVYEAVRSLLCNHYIGSLHGWWTCGFLLGVIWCTALTPLCVKLWRSYSRKIRAHEAMILATLTGRQETPTTAMCDDSNWNTPGPPPPPRSDSW